MKEKLSIEQIEKSVNSIPEQSKVNTKTAVSFKKRKKRRKIKRIIILSIIMVIMAGLGWFGWVSYNSMKNIFGSGDNAPGLLGFLDKKQLKGESSGRVNALLLGVGDEGHAGATLSDTIMLMSYDVKTNNISMVSIPRDMYVKIGSYGYAKINSAHAYGEQYKVSGGGPELAKQTVSNVVDIPIHYYIRADFTGFKKIVDAVGGVDINVEKDLYDPYYPEGTFSVKKGLQHMNGTIALKYARSRETTSDFDRAKRQQQVMVAIKSKIFIPQVLLNPKKMSDIIQIVGDHIKTDFQTSDFQRLLEISKQVDNGKIINKVLDNGSEGLLTSDSNLTAGYYLIPKLGLGNYGDIRDMVKNIFSDNLVKAEGAKISVLNGTQVSGLATSASDRLKSLNYNIVYLGSASTNTQISTIIYDYSNGSKPNTISALEKLLNAKTEKRNSSPNGYDIEIILGRNYKG